MRFPALSQCMRVISFLGICVTSMFAGDREFNTKDITSGHQPKLHNPGDKSLAVTPDGPSLNCRGPEHEQLDALMRSIVDRYAEEGYQSSTLLPLAQTSSNSELVIIVVERVGEPALQPKDGFLWERGSSMPSDGGEVFKL
ncbi:hypothetical protein NF675_14660 [Pseudomonas siliginis]|uniref:hypothetical protein n=1 Tax=Pseudomonas siliginis TaxID=2842346 RepID=UPI00209221A4|nr:hypothetical protein [Pseudomonas siliginis]UST72265.1 hypothetical protein NF675_14660 [Pseudomonas siliginis]